MAFLMRRCLFPFCCFHIVTCDIQYGTPLPAQCDNSVLELAPIRYIANVTNYSNCTIKGQPGTIIHGAIVAQDRYSSTGVTVLAGTILLDGVLLRSARLRIEGDDIAVRNSTISTGSSWTSAVVKGGKVSFEGVQFGEGSLSLINTKATFFRSSVDTYQAEGFEVSNSIVAMLDSSIAVWDDRHINLKASILTLTNSKLTGGHGSFALLDSNATLTNSSMGLYMGTQGMNIGNSTVVADCDSSDVAAFWIGAGNWGSGVGISSSRLTFHRCDCDIGRAIKIGSGSSYTGIRIDVSSVYFEGCAPSASKKVHPILV